MSRYVKWCLHACLGMLLFAIGSLARAEVVLVASKTSPLRALSRHEIVDIFLGNSRNQPRLGEIVPLDQAEDRLRGEFYKTYLDRSLAQVKSHWAKIIFTGRGYPPRTVGSDRELKDVLKANDHAVGYLDSTRVDESLRVIRLE